MKKPFVFVVLSCGGGANGPELPAPGGYPEPGATATSHLRTIFEDHFINILHFS